MNLVRVHRVAADGRDVLRAEGLELPVPARSEKLPGELIVGFRPEDIRLAAEPEADEGRLRGRCELVEYLGAELLVHVSLGGVEAILRDSTDDDIHIGDIVTGAIGAQRLHWFDPANGTALDRAGDRPM